ncbi:MAG: Do family serine endopeptidase [Hyphomicrobiaceae bacterium]|nr:Do family serine endopeptidase [Hyphomicrobiaceae bacterium]
MTDRSRLRSRPRAPGLILAALALAALLGFAGAAEAQRRELGPPRAGSDFSYSPIVKKAAPGVVNVYVRGRVQNPPLSSDPFLQRFLGEFLGMPEERVQSSLGSGVIVSPKGIVVTNTHVVKVGGAAEVKVALADRREFDAKVILQDEKSDIAVLRIDGAGPFPYLEFEDSDALEVGDQVLAIGNPFGIGQTVTSGIISALARTEVTKSGAQMFIQTDAAINPGNSGGALVDMAGRVVGINTAIFTRSGGSHGVGFAIPSNLVRLYVDSAVSGRKIERPWLGARLEGVTRELAEALGLDRVAGALVSSVAGRGPAAAAGLEPGDVIVKVDGYDVVDERAINYRLMTKGIGNTARFEIVRKGKRSAIDIALQSAPEPSKNDVRKLAGQHPLDGTRVANLVPAITDELGISEQEGVVILELDRSSVAARLGFRPGDIVQQIGRSRIDNIATLEAALRERPRVWQMVLKRGNQTLQVQLPAG